MEREHPRDDDLQGWAEASLDPEKARVVEGHMEICHRCREEGRSYRALFRVLETDPPGPPEDLVTDVMEAVRHGDVARPGRIPTVWKVAGIACACVVLVVIASLFDLHGKALEMMPEFSTGVADIIPADLPFPSTVDAAVSHALDGAQRKWTDLVVATEDAVTRRRALAFPVIPVALALIGLLNLAALWKLRGSEEI